MRQTAIGEGAANSGAGLPHDTAAASTACSFTCRLFATRKSATKIFALTVSLSSPCNANLALKKKPPHNQRNSKRLKERKKKNKKRGEGMSAALWRAREKARATVVTGVKRFWLGATAAR